MLDGVPYIGKNVASERCRSCGFDYIEPVGFALYFENFSTFLGRTGLHLEDLFVDPDQRGKGYGKQLFQAVARIAAERGCQRLEWACLNWNQPSIDFYHYMGAVPLEEWTTFRLAGGAIEAALEK